MTRSRVVAGDLAYTVSGLEARARGDIHQAMATVRLVDALTGAPLAVPARVSTEVPGLRPQAAAGGYAGLSGVPSRVLPDLAATPRQVAFRVEADGYLPTVVVAAFAPQPGFPATFAASRLGVLPLGRSPVVVRVSTTELDATNRPVPAPGASVVLTGVWATLSGLGGASATPALLAVAPGLSAARPAGSTVDRPTLGAPPEPPRTLVRAAAAGEVTLGVSRAGAFVPGDLVGVDVGLTDRAERIEVVAVHGTADPESPAVLQLRYPLAHPHPEAAAVARLTVGTAPIPAATTRAAGSGERTLAVTDLAGFGPGDLVRVSGGGAAAEYHLVDRYAATADAQGFSVLPPLTGYAAARVTASTATASGTATVSLTHPTPSLDLTLI